IGGLGAELVGRDAILVELIAAAEQARLGTPRSIVLVGVSGSGKSRVLDEFDARLRLRGARTVRVRVTSDLITLRFIGAHHQC
ncbi:MAG: ATP-binding protein, partial [Candidatus Fonsibacter sp.]